MNISHVLFKVDIEASEPRGTLDGLMFLDSIDKPVNQMKMKHFYARAEVNRLKTPGHNNYQTDVFVIFQFNNQTISTR